MTVDEAIETLTAHSVAGYGHVRLYTVDVRRKNIVSVDDLVLHEIMTEDGKDTIVVPRRTKEHDDGEEIVSFVPPGATA